MKYSKHISKLSKLLSVIAYSLVIAAPTLANQAVQPARVIALAPHLAQLAHSAGAGHMLVAVSEYTPAEYTQKLPFIGNAFAVNWTLLAQLKPTLVLVWGSGTSPAVKARLKALGIATFESEPSTLKDIVLEAKNLALVLKQPSDNAHLKSLEQRFQQVLDFKLNLKTTLKTTSLPIATFHPIWYKPLMTINGKHVMSDAMQHCGARNIFAHAKGLSPTVSLAQVLREKPAVIIMTRPENSDNILDKDRVYDKNSPWYGLLNAFPNTAAFKPKIITVNGNRFHQPGPSLIDETLQLCKALAVIQTAE